MQKKFSFYEFTLLHESEQFALVFLEGEFKSGSERGRSTYCLYKLYDFFVEIEYDVIENRIIGKVCFLSSKGS